MTIAQIACFLKAAECRNISKAAGQMYISQPSLSKHITLLEEELGLRLFERKSQGVSLTKSGEIMRDFFLSAKEQYETAILTAKQYDKEPVRTLRVVCIEGSDISFFYPKFNQILSEKNAKIQLLLEGYNYSSMIQGLQSGSIDVALAISCNFKESKDIAVQHLFTIGGKVLIGNNHPLAKKEKLSPADFRGQTLYSLAPSTMSQSHRSYYTEQFRKRGIEIEISYLPSLSSIFTKLQSGSGFAIVGDWIMIPHNMYVCTFPDDPLDFSFDMGIAWKPKKCSSVTKEFIQIITEYYGARAMLNSEAK